MKKVWLILAMMICVFASCSNGGSNELDDIPNSEPNASSIKTIKSKAGSLYTLLGDDFLNIVSLKITGEINGTDIYYIRRMSGATEFEENEKGKLTSLDLSQATIVEGGDPYYNTNTTSNNVIGVYMFKGCKLERIVLPENAISIKSYAFIGCNLLSDITFPKKITSIGSHAFEYCNSLSKIDIPDGVESIGKCAFYNCISLSNVLINNGTTSIGDYAFFGCDSLTNIVLPESLLSIGKWAFMSCNKLTNIELPENLTSIGERAFWGCDSLISITIPGSVYSMGEYAFSSTGLRKVIIEDGVTSLSKNLFSHCDLLLEASLPVSMQYINNQVFMECYSLSKITIPNNLTYIGENAFMRCNSLEKVVIPNSVTSIGLSAFDECKTLKEVTIGNGITSIGKSFRMCPSLYKVKLGEKVRSLEKGCFSGASITEFYCYSKNPPSFDYFSVGTIEDGAKLFVPKGCLNVYSTSDWNRYFDEIIEID